MNGSTTCAIMFVELEQKNWGNHFWKEIFVGSFFFHILGKEKKEELQKNKARLLSAQKYWKDNSCQTFC
jgi:hypothetical protein